MNPLLLSIETSTKVCSVALHRGSVLLASSEILIEKSHSKFITLLIQNLLEFANEKLEQVDAVAISKGPGSYTGLRIGVSTAKGICYALDKPLIAIDTLQSMAYNVNRFIHSDALLCPMTDARRMEVYCALYTPSLEAIEPVQAKVMDATSFFEVLQKNQVVFFGDGSAKCKPLFAENKNALFVDEVVPSAIQIGAMALKAYENKQFEDLAYFEPFYLKDFVRFGS